MIEKTGNDIFRMTQEHSILFLNTNTLGYGAVGVFKRLRLEFPEAFQEYHDHCKSFNTYKGQEECLGCFFAIPFQKSSVICFGFGQKFYTETKYEVDFDAFTQVLSKIKTQMLKHEKQTGVLDEFHLPWKIGSGMSPEEVEKCRSIVEEMFGETPIKVVYHI